MHYRNGREAKNGDKIIQFQMDRGEAEVVGVLADAVAGEDYCNGRIVVALEGAELKSYACLCDCLHVDDLAELLEERGLNKRPSGK